MPDRSVELQTEGRDTVARVRSTISPAWVVRRSAEAFSRILDLLACAALAGLMLIITADVIGRDLFKKPVPGAIEIAQYFLMVPVVFFSLSAADHIRVRLLTARLPGRARLAVGYVAAVVSVIFTGLMSWKTAEIMSQTWHNGEILEGYLPLPLFPPRAIVFLGSALFFLKLIVVLLKGPREDKEAH